MEQANTNSENSRNKPDRKNLWILVAIAACITILISILVLFWCSTSSQPAIGVISRVRNFLFPRRSLAVEFPCAANLKQLGNAIIIYAHDSDGQFPTPEKWCDLLMSECKVPATAFICPNAKAKKGQSSYAFNKNLVGIDFDLVGPDTIVLFESKPGWNQIAGPNSWNPANHGGKGCNVLYKRGTTTFERAPKGKGLKWTPAGR